MKQVKTIEEAVGVCKENLLNIQFELDLSQEPPGSMVVVSSSPLTMFRATDMVEAVNQYIAFVEAEGKKKDKKIESEEMEYHEQLYCNECGEDDTKNLAYEGNYAGMEKWKCKCGNGFQIKAMPSV